MSSLVPSITSTQVQENLSPVTAKKIDIPAFVEAIFKGKSLENQNNIFNYLGRLITIVEREKSDEKYLEKTSFVPNIEYLNRLFKFKEKNMPLGEGKEVYKVMLLNLQKKMKKIAPDGIWSTLQPSEFMFSYVRELTFEPSMQKLMQMQRMLANQIQKVSHDQSQKIGNIYSLNVDIIGNIMTFLHPHQVVRWAKASRFFCKASNAPAVWRHMCQKSNIELSPVLSAKQMYLVAYEKTLKALGENFPADFLKNLGEALKKKDTSLTSTNLMRLAAQHLYNFPKMDVRLKPDGQILFNKRDLSLIPGISLITFHYPNGSTIREKDFSKIKYALMIGRKNLSTVFFYKSNGNSSQIDVTLKDRKITLDRGVEKLHSAYIKQNIDLIVFGVADHIHLVPRRVGDDPGREQQTIIEPGKATLVSNVDKKLLEIDSYDDFVEVPNTDKAPLLKK